MDRDTFLKPRDLATYTVEIEGLGTVTARELSNGERIKQYDLWLAPKGETIPMRLAIAREKLITLCLVDDAGKLLLTEADIPALKQMPSRIVSQLSQLAMKCLGLSEDDIISQLKKTSNSSEEIKSDT